VTIATVCVPLQLGVIPGELTGRKELRAHGPRPR
jgi:hypothetical protein